VEVKTRSRNSLAALFIASGGHGYEHQRAPFLPSQAICHFFTIHSRHVEIENNDAWPECLGNS
jgi:hypothetical protein